MATVGVSEGKSMVLGSHVTAVYVFLRKKHGFEASMYVFLRKKHWF